MKTKVSFGGHIWSMFQVVVLVVCLQENVSGEIAQGCVGSQLSLRCPEMKVIQITSVVLGDSSCSGSFCCITDSDCTRDANANHRADVHRRCNNGQSCIFDVIQDTINCWYLGWSNNDFERITYNCTEDPQYGTTKSSDEQSTTDSFSHNAPDGTTKSTYVLRVQSTVDSFSHIAQVSVSSTILGIGIVGVVCLIITIGIVALVFVLKIRRKRRKQVRSTDEVGTIDRETDGYETIGINEVQRICIETPDSEYCELDKVDRARVQLDSEYLQLKKKQQVKSTDEAKKFDRETNRNEVTYINGNLETAASLYCELDAVPIEGVARESVQCGSEYLQLVP